ncbi:MAG: CPBP family intramembrane metalloprotease [Anaerolineaceae bacterium]|nr:CPBP family intramembrane metalloprotease [Anaerolineaceae bacterium]MCB9100975.1 CPBP family intramembrane metalloprotease [Anaerolineales bacterium]
MENNFNIPSDPPWTPKDVIWALVLSVVWITAISLLGGLAQFAGLLIDPSLIVVVGTLFLLAPVWYFSIYKYGAKWSDLGLRSFQPKAVGLGCGLMALSFLFNMIYAALLATFGLQIQPDIAPMFQDTGFPLMLLFGGAIIAPVVEEIFFRGFVFAGLRKRWSWPKAALASAGLFALAHIIPTSILPIFILGTIFAFLYQVSGSVWPAILMHMLTNTFALSAAYAISQGWIPAP